MKDYYKILRVRRGAPDEEIRNSWIRLVKKFHSDQIKKGGIEDRRLKDINEAYQVLKHPSTRAEYDLRWAYKKKERRFKKVKVSVFIITLAGFILSLALYTIWNQPLSPSSCSSQTPIISNKVIPYREKLFDPGPVTPFLRGKPEGMSQKNTPPPAIPSKDNLNTFLATPSLEKEVTSEKKDAADSAPQSNSNPILTTDVQFLEKTDSLFFKKIEPTISPIIERVSPSHPIAQSLQVTEADSIYKSSDSENQFQIAQPSTPSTLTTEEEVNRFFIRYTEYYNQRDIDGFLSLFSLKAIQNRRENLERIKEVYTNFFNNSKEVRYRIEEIEMKIYQNTVEVKGRYEIFQVTKKGQERLWKGNICWVLGKEGGKLKILSLDYQHQKSS